MWITEHVAGARELFARWAGVLDIQQFPAAPPPVKKPAHNPQAPPIGILGVPFEPLTLGTALERVDALIQSGQPHYLATANVDFLIQARHDVELQRVLNQAALVVCDGTPILWLSRFFGNPLPERVAGSDLTPLLIERAAEKGYRIFFLGGHPEVAAAAVSRLQERFPNLVVAGHYSPPFRPLMEMNDDEIVSRIRQARPDIVFVSFGCPKAEKWMAMNYRRAGVPVMIGVGATIDFLAGRVKRAPKWMQQSGTEWLYRLAQEPRRLFRRYARDFAELGFNIVGQWWHCRPAVNAPSQANAILVDDPTWLQLRLPAGLDHNVVRRDARVWQRISGKDCLVQMQGVKCIDSTGMALLARLHHRLKAQGKNLILLNPSRRVLRAIRWMGIDPALLIASSVDDARTLLEKTRNEASEPVVESAVDWTLPLMWRGEVTCANADLVWERTHEYLSMCSTRRDQTAIDVSEVRFFDSAGLSVMLRSRAYAHELGLELNFTGVSRPLRRLIQIAGVERQLFGRQKVVSAPAEPFATAHIPVPAV